MSMTTFSGGQAQELTQEQQEAKAQHCANLEAQVKDGLKSGRESLWRVAEALYEFDEESGWQMLGYEALGDWLAQPDVTMTYRTFRRLSAAYRELAIVRKIDMPTLAALDVSKVDIALPALKKSKVTLDQFKKDVEALGAQDLRDKYVPKPEAKSDPEPEDDDVPADGKVGVGVDSEPTTAADMDDDDVIEGHAVEAMTLGVAVAELQSAYDSGATHPRIDRQAVEAVLVAERSGALSSSNGSSSANEAVEAFLVQFRAAPRSRHVPEWVETLASSVE